MTPGCSEGQRTTSRRPTSVLTALLVAGMVAGTSSPCTDGTKPSTPIEGAIVVVPIRLTKQATSQREATGTVPACAVIDRATQGNPAAIVLDIDGGGANAEELEQLGACIVKAQESGQRVIAWPDHVQGTAVEITLACREIACRPDTLIGTPASGTNSRPPIEPSAQLASRIAKATGRSDCIARALREPRAELWWSPTVGFRATRGDGPDWRQLDDNSGIRPLSSNDLARYGLRTGIAASRSELWSALSGKAATDLSRDTPLVVMDPSQEHLLTQPPAPKKTETPKPDPEKREAEDARRLERFAEQLQKFRSTLGEASAELSNIQRQFPGPPPDGDMRDPEWVDWAMRCRPFMALQSRASTAISRCSRALPSVPTRPAQADQAGWNTLQENFRQMRKVLDTCRKDLGKDGYWMHYGAGPALQTLKQCDSFVAELLK